MSSHQTAALDDASLARYAPSVFAEHPYHEVSDRYGFIPTIRVIEALRGEGWKLVSAAEQRVRIEDKRGFTKHLIRFRHVDAKPVLGDVYPEIVLINSHDRSSAYTVEAGLIRFACMNGLIVSDGSFGGFSVYHSQKDIVGRVLEGTCNIVREIPQIAGKVEQMHAVKLAREEQEAFAVSAQMLRWEERTPVTSDQLLRIRRGADTSDDLWTVYNRVQENLLRGGMRGVNARGRRMKVRAVKSINEDTRINRALWALAEKMAMLKAA